MNTHLVASVVPWQPALDNLLTLLAEPSQPFAGEDQQRLVRDFFEQCESVQSLPEHLMDAAVAEGSTSKALSFLALDAIIDASVGIKGPCSPSGSEDCRAMLVGRI